MVLTAEITVSTDTFALGSLFETFPNAVVEFEPVVPLQGDRETNTRSSGSPVSNRSGYYRPCARPTTSKPSNGSQPSTRTSC